MATDDDYSQHPKSIAEVKADKARLKDDDAHGIEQPRDILISMLRDIDNGKVKPTQLSVVFAETLTDGQYTSVRSSSPAYFMTLGMLMRAIQLYQ